MEKIINIEEVAEIQLNITGNYTDTVQLGMNQCFRRLMGTASYDGFKIATTEHTYHILIDNGQNCCESWGYFSTNDDVEEFIGKSIAEFYLTDTALNTKKVESSGYYKDRGGIQFVNFKCDDGEILQFAVYNAHNGYYGHPIVIIKDEKVILDKTL